MPSTPPDDPTRLRNLARHLEVFEAAGFEFGRWVPSRPRDDGVIVMGWYERSPAADAFCADAMGLQTVSGFDWPAWSKSERGLALIGHPAAVATASVEELANLLTAYIRADRFSEGTLAEAFETGMLTAILRRAQALSGG
jgi:hypothetical protein